MKYLKPIALYLALGVFLALFGYCSPVFQPEGAYSSYLASLQDEEEEEDDRGEDEDEEDEEDDDRVKDDDEDNDEENDRADFPYDAAVDTIALMSCAYAVKNSFHLKLGAYDHGGVRFASAKYSKKKTSDLKKDYPKIFSSAIVSPNINSRSAFVWKSSIGPLDRRLDALIKSGEDYVKTFRGKNFEISGVDSKSMKNKLSYPRYLIDQLENNDLTLAYINRKNQLLKNEDGDTYGRAYSILLNEKEQNRYFLDSIDEENLSTGDDGEDWSCPIVYEIRRHRNHRGDGELDCGSDGKDNKSNKQVYDLLRLLLGRYWLIDTSRKCAAPTKPSIHCYPPRVSTGSGQKSIIKVNFGSESGDCNNSSLTAYCPHYLSVCIRE